MKRLDKILLSGGGTGGHIYPAVAIADEVKKRYPGVQILFVGASDRMEMEKVPQAGYQIEGLNISGIQRSLSAKNLMFPFKLINSLYKARKIIKKFKPDVVIGTGGFASGPTLYMAVKEKIPTLIQEQNSYPGITNKLLAGKAGKICVAYDGMAQFFPEKKIIKTGNPVRQDLLQVNREREQAVKFFKLNKNKKTLVILGGSLGSKMINLTVEKNLRLMLKDHIQIIWQTGKLYHNQYKKYNDLEGVKVLPFVQRMDLLYSAADILVSRAGAGTISELCIVGKPVIFIPSPNVAEDHQTKNAEAVIRKNAALMVKETELDEFINVVRLILHDESKQKELSRNIKKMALPNATKRIVDAVVALKK